MHIFYLASIGKCYCHRYGVKISFWHGLVAGTVASFLSVVLMICYNSSQQSFFSLSRGLEREPESLGSVTRPDIVKSDPDGKPSEGERLWLIFSKWRHIPYICVGCLCGNVRLIQAVINKVNHQYTSRHFVFTAGTQCLPCAPVL